MSRSPTIPPPGPKTLNRTLERNIQILRDRKRAEEQSAPFEERVAQKITAFTGSIRFIYVHAAIYGGWIVANLGWLGVEPWDRTFVVLAMIASVEAIFLSTFILISQNRMAATADSRAELDLQVSLLAEQEITKLVQLVAAIADRLEVAPQEPEEVEEMKRGVAPEAVLDAIETKDGA